MMSQNENIVPTKSVHLPALDGLRGIAILLVVLYHFTPERNSDQGLRAILFKIADLGWSGVDLFFVLSGFLVTSLLMKVKRGDGGLLEFWLRRAFRVLPAYFAVLLVVFYIFPLFSAAYPIPPVEMQLPFWLLVSNYVQMVGDFSEGRFILGHFWSLGVEVQFYLLWPLVVLRFGTRGVTTLIGVMISIAVAGRLVLTLSDAHWTTTFAWLPFRVDCLLAGSLVALHWKRPLLSHPRSKAWLWFALMCSSFALAAVAWYGFGNAVFKAPERAIFVVVRVALPMLLFVFYGSLLAVALHRNWLASFLAAPIFAPLARYSYSLYLVHFLVMPVLFFQIELFLSPGIIGDMRVYGVAFVAFMVVYLFAIVSYFTIEKPFIDWGSSICNRMRSRRSFHETC